jgi:hypothetical protein
MMGVGSLGSSVGKGFRVETVGLDFLVLYPVFPLFSFPFLRSSIVVLFLLFAHAALCI